jgi:hypothetical protein
MSEIKGRNDKEKERKFIKQYLLIITMLPIISVVTRLPATVNRVYGIFISTPLFVMYLLHVIFWTLTGFFNSLTYFYFFRNTFRCKKNITPDI